MWKKIWQIFIFRFMMKLMLLIAIATLLMPLPQTVGFGCIKTLSQTSTIRSRSHHRSISTTLMKASEPFPRKIKDTVSELRSAVQEGLKMRCSRMDIELPYGSTLGVESTAKNQPFDEEQLNRELARLFLEMFDPIGDATVVAFKTEDQAQRARSIWSTSSYKGAVQSMSPAKEKKKKDRKHPGGFAKKLADAMSDDSASSIVPPNTEVFIAVAPDEKELQMIRNLDLGADCLCILLNARLDRFEGTEFGQLKDSFEGVFHLKALDGSDTENFLYRSFPNEWTISRKPKIGSMKVIKTFTHRPSQATVMSALREKSSEKKLFGDLF